MPLTMVRRILLAALVAALIPASALAARTGDRAPDISLPRPGGGQVSLQALLASGPVMVWFPDAASVTPEGFAPLVRTVTAEKASLLIIPVVGSDAAAASDLAGRFPELVILHDADGSVTLNYAGEFIPGVSPRQNLFVVSTGGRVTFARFWPGVPESTLQDQVRSAR